VSALISAVVLTYITVIAPGCFACHARSSSGVIESASEQPASRSGIRTVLSGESTDAVSAMKCTPQNATTPASVAAACRLRPSESPT
jgi:N-acyl-D-aspartate/D-glutamate deacylase